MGGASNGSRSCTREGLHGMHQQEQQHQQQHAAMTAGGRMDEHRWGATALPCDVESWWGGSHPTPSPPHPPSHLLESSSPPVLILLSSPSPCWTSLSHCLSVADPALEECSFMWEALALLPFPFCSPCLIALPPSPSFSS
eukprot:4671549-Pyramimonas_sp.AAC.1